ncbi:ubiquitin-specific protease doa4 [Mortierella sp. GBA30]|nr:ubiquitin-specific protease doa4 [Mortierella sp. GBA30]
MLPTTTNINVLDSPAKKIKDLIGASKVQYDPSFSLKTYVRSAQSILNRADMSRVRGDMEGAFVNYLKATSRLFSAVCVGLLSIVLEVVPQDKDFEKNRMDPEYIAIKKRIVDLISDTEKIKELLQAKYVSIQDIEASALATAAKAGRPKPPPRPSKPEFLSSSRHDGQAPITASSPVMQSSFSAPATPATGHISMVSPSNIPPSSSPQIGASQASMATLSTTSSTSTPSMPPPTSLPSYRPLQPTVYGIPPSSPSSLSFQANMVSSTSTVTSGTVSTTQSATTAPISGSSTPAAKPTVSPSLDSVPIPASRPTQAVVPPASAPAALPNGAHDAKLPVPTSTQSRSTSENTDVYTYPLSIKPQRLLDYMKQPNGPSLLMLDVRMQVQYKSARVKAKSIVNVEPLALRDGVSAKVLADQGLFNNPPAERKFFVDRATFDLVIYYDQNSEAMSTSVPLSNLFRALHDLEFDRPLHRRPVLLVGGFDAWLECAGMDWVEGHDVDAAKRIGPPSPSASEGSLQRPGSAPIPQDHMPHNHAIFAKMAQGGGINRYDGRIIMRKIGDIIQHDDAPQSMMNPQPNPSIGYNSAYPPHATPHSNANASAYPPQPIYSGAAAYNGYPGNMGHHILSPDSSATHGKLNRRQTIYDNHWNNFGAPEKPFTLTITAPPVPEKIPLPGSSMSTASAASIVSSGPALPSTASTMVTRPAIPTKPMRPLPQPPGMNDLRDYTQFGSGFSKIGGSQLGKTGLTNLGNTCFMNSVIQCLIATPPLSRFFLDGSFKRHINARNPLGTQGRLAEAFSDLIRSMWSGQSLVVSPTSFRYAIGGFAPQFKGTEQHDSQEFLSFLLDGLHEDLKTEPQPPPPGDEEGSDADEARMERLPDYEASEIAWQRYLRRDNSIIVSLFQGQFKNRLCCSKCGKTSTTYNAFMYLALPIKAKVSGRQPQTLQSCLNAFVEPEIMEGDNAWNCPNCKKPRKATKQLTISRVPDVLLIQLKRFSSEGPFKNKIKAMVQYPIQDLDLTKYLPKRLSSGSNNGMISEPAVYDLYAVSNHSGEVSSGHYTACVRGEAPNSWTNFDDTRVSPCDKSVAVSEHGYTLFYVRKK